MSPTLLLDGNALMHRSFYAVQFRPMFEGQPVGMVYGFAATLLEAMRIFSPSSFCVAFDTKEKTFRHDLDEDYKAQRKKAPDEFYDQIPLIFDLVEALGLQVIKKPGYEADDIIGTLATFAKEKQRKSFILSGDYDFLQLVDDEWIKLVKFNGGLTDSPVFGTRETHEKYGIYPHQIIDFKAICGDSSDNYKGIPSIGEKTAVKLLQKYGDLLGIYSHLELLPDRVKKAFSEHKASAKHCQKLAEIHTEVPIEKVFSDFCPFVDRGFEFLGKMGFSSLQRRYENLNKKSEQLNNYNASEKEKIDYDKNKTKEQKNCSNQMSLF